MNKQSNTTETAIDANRVLTPDFCIGWYYNFKKGKESCQNRSKCQLYRNFQLSDYDYSKLTIDSSFKFISEFRKCKKYIENPTKCDFCSNPVIEGKNHCEKCACLRVI